MNIFFIQQGWRGCARRLTTSGGGLPGKGRETSWPLFISNIHTTNVLICLHWQHENEHAEPPRGHVRFRDQEKSWGIHGGTNRQVVRLGPSLQMAGNIFHVVCLGFGGCPETHRKQPMERRTRNVGWRIAWRPIHR